MLLVFGSINLDLSFECARLPVAGETVLAMGCLMSPGGKGANQAHAAQRYGVPTRLVGAVGTDAFAAPALQGLRDSGVDLSLLCRHEGATGLASIVVDAQGENQIVVASGANLALHHGSVTDAALRESQALLLQMETEAAQNFALVERAQACGVPVLLNNAPAQRLPTALLRQLAVLIVNETELRLTARAADVAGDDLPHMLSALADGHGLTVLVTLGRHGVMARADRRTLHLPAMAVPIRDTTGAGDTFAGVFGAAWVEAHPLHECLRRASVAAALACTRTGAQQAQPTRVEIELALPRYAA